MSSIKSWSHWTPEGAFKITPKVLATSWFYELSLGDRPLATYDYAFTAAGSIGAGEHDSTIGAKGASLNVPDDPAKWNGFT